MKDHVLFFEDSLRFEVCFLRSCFLPPRRRLFPFALYTCLLRKEKSSLPLSSGRPYDRPCVFASYCVCLGISLGIDEVDHTLSTCDVTASASARSSSKSLPCLDFFTCLPVSCTPPPPFLLFACSVIIITVVHRCGSESVPHTCSVIGDETRETTRRKDRRKAGGFFSAGSRCRVFSSTCAGAAPHKLRRQSRPDEV
ncbi:hypothetical protein Naga_100148g15 [Nannochloropsis gaditana]|uniref:Uncharacterized protein n=1 Tax=Nannochloropsis gaditana TaxID=72520 RepID=W7TDC0_9STRA|nr:hypothetical protein Naga_100148g15 [Nannochloropsis gaditana]